MQNELNSLNKHNAWEVIDKPENIKKIIKSKWVYALKENESGEKKYKARLVAAGFNQIKNIDFSESYPPVFSIEVFRLLISFAAKLNLIVIFFYAKPAYLYNDLEETIYTTPLQDFEETIFEGKILKLKKSIYGLPQSGRSWYLKIKSELEKNWFSSISF